MGQKVNPIIFRMGVKGCLTWTSRWFSQKKYADTVLEDLKIRNYLYKNYAHTKIDKIEIERSENHIRIIIHSANPGLLIGKKGQDIENLRKNIASFIKNNDIEISVSEIKEPLFSARVVAQGIAEQLEKRISFKKVIKKSSTEIMRASARGVKICVSGRLDGSEIARTEWVRVGSIPLHTLRADIDYGFYEAKTTYGIIGVKVWICRGEYKIGLTGGSKHENS
jgi:small subunit ribosomal protein S3